jgi:hypothetical protein
MRAQYDFGDGPLIGQVKTTLFCLWLAWSRYRVVLPLPGQDVALGGRSGRRGAAPGRRVPVLPADR